MNAPRASRSVPLVAGLCALLVAGVSGCGKNTDSPAQWASELNAAEARWAAGNVQNYTFGLIRICNCVANQIRPVTVTVRNGVATRIVYADSAGGFADTTLFREYLTIPRYFTLLDQVLASGPAHFSATYSPSIGFPTYVQVDPLANTVDEEFTIQTITFVVDTP